MSVQNYTIYSTKNTKDPRAHHTPGHNTSMKNNHTLSEKAPAETFDDNNDIIFQNIVGKLLYYAREIDPTILMTRNSLAAL